MLIHLSVRNVAVIDRLQVDLQSGMTVLTGETGAGKSILIDSINMILGERTNKELVRFGEEKAFVEAIFEAGSQELDELEQKGIETDEGQVILTRQISAEGKSICRINGTVVNLSFLRDFASRLINIHGQHDNQALLDGQKHILFLDGFGSYEDLLTDYQKQHRRWKEIQKSICALQMDEKEKMQKIDLLEYQIREIEAAKLKPGEETQLTEQRNLAANAEKIAYGVEEAYSLLYEGGQFQPAYDSVSRAAAALEPVCAYDERLGVLYNTLSEVMYTVEDAAHELKEISQTVEFDEQQLNEIEERLDLIFKLRRKYGNSTEEILGFYENAVEELEGIRLGDERLAKLGQELEQAEKDLAAIAAKLGELRRQTAAQLEREITDSLKELDMEKAQFQIEVKKGEAFLEDGMDKVRFMICTNPGEPAKPLEKIASGGELSRVMLAIKSVLADSDQVRTLIFDEIDTGVSGSAAQKIAKKLQQIGTKRQVICISHLPQLAAAADHHFLIEKQIREEKAYTTLTKLEQEQRQQELARIIDGSNPSETALSHAREMLLAARKEGALCSRLES